MRNFWRNISPYWHILTGVAGLIVFAILWVDDVSSYGHRIETIEGDIPKMKSAIIRMDYYVERLAKKQGIDPYTKPKEIE